MLSGKCFVSAILTGNARWSVLMLDWVKLSSQLVHFETVEFNRNKERSFSFCNFKIFKIIKGQRDKARPLRTYVWRETVRCWLAVGPASFPTNHLAVQVLSATTVPPGQRGGLGRFFRPSATLCRIGLMESCLHHHCHGGPPPLASRPPRLADPPPHVTDGWGARPLR